MQMSPQTPHKAIQREAASPGLNSPLNPVQLLPSKGKGSARIFSLLLEGGRRRREPSGPEVEEGCSGSVICAIDPSCRGRKTVWRVQWLWGRRASGAVGTAKLQKPVQRRCGSREAAGPFRPTKAGLNRGAHNSMKGRAWAVWTQSGITAPRGTHKLLTSTRGGVAAPFVRSVRR